MALLKVFIKETMACTLYQTGLMDLLGLKKNRRKSPLILYFHRVCNPEDDFLTLSDLVVSTNNFEKQMKFLKDNFDILPVDFIVKKLKNGDTLTDNTISITFDDGYIDNFRYAYPILKKYGIPATIFLTTGYIGSGNLLWWDKLALIVDALQDREIRWDEFSSDLLTGDLRNLLRNKKVLKKSLTPLTNYLKGIGGQKREETIQLLGEIVLSSGSASSSPRIFLSWQEIREMSVNGIDFGSHTHTHAILTEVNEVAIKRELRLSKELIWENVGREPSGFSYPDGCLNHQIKAFVIEAGYHYALQTNRLARGSIEDVYAIPRKMVKEGHSRGYLHEFSEALFAMELYGITDELLLRSLRKKNPYAVSL